MPLGAVQDGGEDVRLIDKDALKEKIEQSGGEGTIARYCKRVLVECLDNDAPTIDAIPVWWLRDILQQAVDSGGRYRDVANGLELVLAMWEEKQEAQDG